VQTLRHGELAGADPRDRGSPVVSVAKPEDGAIGAQTIRLEPDRRAALASNARAETRLARCKGE
jgi:hypothetical protein